MTGTATVEGEILLVEDEPHLADLYRRILAANGWAATLASTLAEARKHLARRPRVMLLDLNLPDGDGLDLLREVAPLPHAPVTVVVTARGSVRTAVEAMQVGAYDFLAKPIAAERLSATVRNALDRARMQQIVEDLTQAGTSEFHGMVGASPAMQAVYRMIPIVAQSAAPVLVTGESGTGKELCAAAIHRLGRTPAGPFVTVNCAAIPRALAESELFGHVRGAFTGATSDRKGAAASAAGGTLFLDEIGELDQEVQAKLLRFTQTMTFLPVGGDRPAEASLRLVCATNRNLAADVAAGRFREDLFYRIDVLSLELPPLRERGDDVVRIAARLLERFGAEERKTFTGFTEAARDRLRRWRWPGNIRELENVVRATAVLAPGGLVDEAMLARLVDDGPIVAERPDEPWPMTAIRPLAEVEQEAIERALVLCGGNAARAARALGIGLATIYRRRRSAPPALVRRKVG